MIMGLSTVVCACARTFCFLFGGERWSEGQSHFNSAVGAMGLLDL